MANRKNKKRAVDATGRNKNAKYVKLDEWLLKAPAYRLLTAGARALLVEFLRLYNGGNNGRLYLSQRDAAKVLGISTHQTAGKFLNELEARGFIRVVVPGSFDNKDRHASTYRLTMWEYNGKPPTKEFMSLKLTEKEKSRVAKNTPSWAKLRPAGAKILPDGYQDEWENQPRALRFAANDGSANCTTYNIPEGAGSDGAFEGSPPLAA